MRGAHFVVCAVVGVLLQAWPGAAEALRPIGGYDWVGWTNQGGVAVSGPDCVSAAEMRIDCFVRSQDGQMWRRAWDGRGWKAWAGVPGVSNAALYEARPSCVSWGADHIDCFVRRHGDGAMFRRAWNGAYVHSWENLGGTLASDPACVAKARERLDCFARGEDGAMWQNSFDGNGWSGWVSRGGDLADETKPACALRSAGKIECVAVWDDKSLRHFAVHDPQDGWAKIDSDPVGLPSSENAAGGAKCYGAPDDARIDCFAPVATEDGHALAHLRYDGDWTVDDLGLEFGKGTTANGQDVAHYDFDCVVRAGDRFDCMELTAWRPLTGGAKTTRFRHYAYALGGPPVQWRTVPLQMPIEAGNVTFLKCLSIDGERMDCFAGGNWQGNSTLLQASFVFQERIIFEPMRPVR